MKNIKFTSLAGCLLIGCVFFTTVPGVPKATPGATPGKSNPQAQSSPRIINAKLKGSKIIILGENFSPETVVLINGQAVKTIVDSESPTTILVAKKINKVTPMGVEVRLQTQNPTGQTSVPFDFFVGQIILIDDANKTFTLKVGESIMLILQKVGYEWTPGIQDPLILQKVEVSTIIKGQGIFQAQRVGTTILNAIGEYPCNHAEHPCGVPSLSFQVNIVVQQ